MRRFQTISEFSHSLAPLRPLPRASRRASVPWKAVIRSPSIGRPRCARTFAADKVVRAIIVFGLRRELAQESPCLFEVSGVEALGEPAVDRREQIESFHPPALLAPQSGEITDGAQFQRFCLLGLCDADCLLKGGLALVELISGEQHSPSKAVEFRIPPVLAAAARYFQPLL